MDYNDDWDISTAFTRGRNALVVIKTGSGGTVEGYKGKYKALAEKIHTDTGFAVLVADNPAQAEKEANFDVTMTATEFSMDVTDTDDGSELPVYYIGFSSAAAMGAMYGYKYPYISRMLLINPPLMINWHKIKTGLEKYSGEKAEVLIGSLDPSYKYLGLLEFLVSNNLTVLEGQGMDHHLSGNEDELYAIISIFLKQ